MWSLTRLFRLGGHEGPYMGCGYEMYWDKAARDTFPTLQVGQHVLISKICMRQASGKAPPCIDPSISPT